MPQPPQFTEPVLTRGNIVLPSHVFGRIVQGISTVSRGLASVRDEARLTMSDTSSRSLRITRQDIPRAEDTPRSENIADNVLCEPIKSQVQVSRLQIYLHYYCPYSRRMR